MIQIEPTVKRSRAVYQLFERAKDIAICDMRGYTIATVPRSKSVDQTHFREMATQIAESLIAGGYIR